GLENSAFERRGYITADVKVSHRNHTKHCRISKQFLLTRLFAPPFHRFSLFASNAAAMDPEKVNRLEKFYDDGTVLDDKPPLQLFNQRITGNTDTLTDVNYNNRNVNPVINSADSFVQNGWIFFGSGYSGDKTLTLNIMSGAMGDMPDNSSDSKNHKKYGEFFHLYYTDKSLGWRGSQAWSNWLNSRFPGIANGDPPAMKISYVDYGYFRFLGQNPSIEINQLEAPPDSGQLLSWNFREKHKASAIHLFGTPSKCTPTLVFGKVNRQFYRVSAFLIERTVWPLRTMLATEFGGLYQQISDWMQSMSGDKIDQARDALVQMLPKKTTATPDDGSQPLVPQPDPAKVLSYDLYLKGRSKDPVAGQPLWPYPVTEPYLNTLKNLAKPTSVETWQNAVPQNKYMNNGPDELFKSDYEFKSDENLHYSGKINAIKVDPKYIEALRQRTSYYITQKPTGSGKLQLSKCKFFMDEFIDDKASTPNNMKACYLNQIIGFESPVEIDVPLQIIKGGIIWPKNEIYIASPIVNPQISGSSTPDNFGWLTLVSGKSIHIRGLSNTGAKGYPELHAFLVACNGGTGKIVIDSPVHLIGGVAVDDMSELVEKGSVIEWGFLRGELSANGKSDMTSEDFYGLSMGPMDGEVVFEQ
ncbi:MAG TPA: hypothetical protein PKM25_15275, partial [Candidatus Ozemobacteraceae bacterium]|nr:hypothetical protein [Candidatus Ozemobacteraceae bacterium]